MNKPIIQYAIWQTDGDIGYYEVYESMSDAVSASEENVPEIFEVTYKSLGHYKIAHNVKKVKLKKDKK